MVDRRKFNSVSIYRILKHTINNELDELKTFVLEIAHDLQSKQENLEKDFNDAIVEVNEEEKDHVHLYYEDDINKYFKTFPVYTFNPILLTVYSLFENWLKQLCDFDNRRGFSNVKISNLSGNNYIEKSRLYLNLIAEVNLDKVAMEWQRIKQIQKLRNCIAHNNSSILIKKDLPVEKQDLFNILKKDKRIHLDEKTGDFYIQDKEFIVEAITLVKTYLTHISTQLSVRKVIAKNTTMPYNNDNWGEEKTEELLKLIITGIEMLDENEKRTDDFKDSDLKFNLRGHFETMAWDITKLYAFFCDGKWETKDAKLIVTEKKKGLQELRALYKGNQ